jgi:hypothetical protein
LNQDANFKNKSVEEVMTKKLLLLAIALFAPSFLFSQVTIGWQLSSIEVDAGVGGQQIFVFLTNSYSNKGVWSFRVDITSTTVALNTGNVALYTGLSSNFNYSETNISGGVRVIVWGRTNSRMFQPGFSSSVLVVTLPSLSAGSYSITLGNASAVIRNYPGGGGTPSNVTPTLSPATISITASTFTPPTSSPTHTAGGYTGYPRKYGDINWDNSVNIVDVTAMADVVIGNYSAVSVSDPVYGSRNFYSDPNTGDGYDAVSNDQTTADVNGGDGTLDLMDLATLEDAVVSGVWPSYAISAIAGSPVFKVNDNNSFGSGAILAKFDNAGKKITANATLKFEVFSPGTKTSKVRVKLVNNEQYLRGFELELISSVLPGKIDVWKMPDANGLNVKWARNDFNQIKIIAYANGGEYIKTGESVLFTIVIPNVTAEQIINAEPKILASINNTGTELLYNVGNFEDVLPLDYMLYQNYPNPFNPGTEIKFDIPEYSTVKIIVWNILGQKVRTLVEANLDPGRKSVRWDGRDDAGNPVGSGVYFYTMYAKSLEDGREFTMTRKAILMK